MALNRLQAAKLLTAKELGLFQDSLSDRAPELDDRELHATMRQLRSSRDKYQDLLRRQRVSSRGRTGSKSGPRGSDNQRTEKKVEAFAQALHRLEQQQQARERARQRKQASSDPRPAAWREATEGNKTRKRSGAPGRPGSSDAPAKVTQAAAGIRQARKLQDMGGQRPLAHVSSRGRRKQARRDSGH